MGEIITDGTGSGYDAAVTQDNRLKVQTEGISLTGSINVGSEAFLYGISGGEWMPLSVVSGTEAQLRVSTSVTTGSESVITAGSVEVYQLSAGDLNATVDVNNAVTIGSYTNQQVTQGTNPWVVLGSTNITNAAGIGSLDTQKVTPSGTFRVDVDNFGDLGSSRVVENFGDLGSQRTISAGSIIITNEPTVNQGTNPWIILGSTNITNAAGIGSLDTQKITPSGTFNVEVDNFGVLGSSRVIENFGDLGSERTISAGSVIITNTVDVSHTGSFEVFQTDNADMQVQATQEGTWDINNLSTGSVRVVSQANTERQISAGSVIITNTPSVNQGTDPWIVLGSQAITNTVDIAHTGSLEVFQTVNADMQVQATQEGTWDVNNLTTGSVRVVSQADKERTITAGSVRITSQGVDLNVTQGTDPWVTEGSVAITNFGVLGSSRVIENFGDLGSSVVITNGSQASSIPTQGPIAEGGKIYNPVIIAGDSFFTPGSVSIPTVVPIAGVKGIVSLFMGLNGGLPNATSAGGLWIEGNRNAGFSETGNPVKIGGQATDYEPDTDAEQGPALVANGNRQNAAFNRRGEIIEGVNPRYNVLDNVSTTYNNSTTSATSTAIECWNYRYGALAYDLRSSGTAVPGKINFRVEVSSDGTNYQDYSVGALNSLVYTGSSAIGSINQSYSFPLASQKIRVTVEASGTSSSGVYFVDNATLYLRN